jgi:hypothetical protein
MARSWKTEVRIPTGAAPLFFPYGIHNDFFTVCRAFSRVKMPERDSPANLVECVTYKSTLYTFKAFRKEPSVTIAQEAAYTTQLIHS